ncbi:class I adenylate-forming enzyme family protein [Porphyromonas pogonae]|uniref:class I adenylate-forming enzyme family protein n=1 Tax=Porphyromonas pogonae TaxID=867595 RepID=UPI002E78F561|nr:AMP-binding protein [Porphyromonas pogonae]
MNKKLLKALFELHLISGRGLLRFSRCLFKEGISLMALLGFTKQYYGNRVAVSCEGEPITYHHLYRHSHLMASYLYHHCHITPDKRVAILYPNSIELLYCLFGLSYIGANIYLLNQDLSNEQLIDLIKQKKINFCISDAEKKNVFTCNHELSVINIQSAKDYIYTDQSQKHKSIKRKMFGRGELIVLTGGTSGQYKSAARKPSVFNFLNPFFALIEQIGIHRYSSVYIAPPIYHGFGLAAVIVTLLMGKTIFLRYRFSAEAACDLVYENAIPLLVAVPTMVRRMLECDINKLTSIQCILSGGAPLDQKLVRKTQEYLGEVLYNLYGTSEAGFFIMATPQDLNHYPLCVGRPIKGVKIRIAQQDKNGTGLLQVKSAWAMDQAHKAWQCTGDRAKINETGIIHLQGRADKMIVSGGENVYPEDIERVLLSHHCIHEAIVLPVEIDDFGQRLHAFVVTDNPTVSDKEIIEWLKKRLARFQMPYRTSIVTELPTLSTGKVAPQKLLSDQKDQ